MNILEKIFLSKARAGIFKVLFFEKDKEYYLRELERKTGVGFKALHSDIYRMVDLDLVIMRKDGNRIYFKANKFHPLFDEFHSISHKIYGPIPLLKEMFENEKKVKLAFVFGSYAKGETHAVSDIDLFVIGNISARVLSELLWDIQKSISYEINDHIFSKKDFIKKIKGGDHFLSSLRSTEKIFIKGCPNEFNEIFKG